MNRLIPLLLAFLLVSLTAFAADKKSATKASKSAGASWKSVTDEFLKHYYTLRPSSATQDGLHEYDGKLEDFSRAGVDHELALWKLFLPKLSAVKESSLSADDQLDRQRLIDFIRQRQVTLENIRAWEKDPDTYQSNLSNSIFGIMAREYAPAEQRLQSVIARERLMPKVFADARANLKNPPRIYTEIALEQNPGLISFFRNDVPLAFNKVTDQKLLADFKKSNDAVISQLKSYQEWMKSDLLPRSNGSFAIGAENFSKLLLYREEVDIPLDRLLEIGMADLRKNQQWFRDVAKKIDPNKTPDQLHEEMLKNHPSETQLLKEYGDLLDGLRAYVIDHKIMTVPNEEKPVMEETPPFERATTFASMDAPGPFETHATKAFFNATLPEKNWTQEKKDSLLSGHARPVMVAVAVHEVWPGHYMQYVWQGRFPSKLRAIGGIAASTNVEGWAHYTEQMMLDEGYGNNDPMLRLGQLQDALLRNARFIVGIKLHTGKMTLDQAREFFVKEGLQTEAVADVETKRGTSDALYLYYNLGKQQILKLREDYKKKIGDKYSLQQFHDEFMRHGHLPIKMIRRDMLGNDSPTL